MKISNEKTLTELLEHKGYKENDKSPDLWFKVIDSDKCYLTIRINEDHMSIRYYFVNFIDTIECLDDIDKEKHSLIVLLEDIAYFDKRGYHYKSSIV